MDFGASPIWTAFLFVFLVELVDKSQFVLVALASRGRPWTVWFGALTAFAVLVAVAVTAGHLLGRFIPVKWALIGGGAILFALGVVHLLRRPKDDDSPLRPAGFVLSFALVFVSELGDESQLVLAGLSATSGNPVGIGVAGFVALALAAAVGVAFGSRLTAWIGARRMHTFAAFLLLAIGLGMFLVGVF